MALTGDQSRELSRSLIHKYFTTISYPYTRHHIESYDQFLQEDLPSIIRSKNPIVILKDLLDGETNMYKYRVEIFIGGEDGKAIEIGTPTIHFQEKDDIRILYPNEARLRNLTYASTVYADIIVKITYINELKEVRDISPSVETFKKWPLFKMPIMLHSRYCILHNKSKEFLKQAGECPYDNGGYFIVDGSEKVLITRQEQAFNTLYITPQNDPKVEVYSSIQCLSAKTRQVKRIAIALMRYVEKDEEKKGMYTSLPTIRVSLPFIRSPVPLFVLFRALGFQSDEEILKMIFPDFESSEAKVLLPKLQPSILDAFPYLNTYTAIQYLKTLTKGFSEAHVLDIIKNQLFIHMPNDTTSQALFLGDCVRRILRVSEGYDEETDRDDTRNQRCLTSGFLIQELFNNSYKLWIKAFTLVIDKEYNYNKGTLYKDMNFANIFTMENGNKIFATHLLQEMIMKGFKGKWGTGLGEEKSGVLQALSRLSYTDFMSHCRRVILNFDTGMKLTGPRKLHTSQYGYFCTSETPTGASIGITKNLSIFTAISTASKTSDFFDWLRTKGRVYKAEDITVDQRIFFVPVYINGGIFGYSKNPTLLITVLKLFKRSGCLPYSVSISFSIRDRKVYIYMDAGRPLRPLIWLNDGQVPIEKLQQFTTWRDLVLGRLESRQQIHLDNTDFFDPILDKSAKLEDYPGQLQRYTGAIEYVDPYEQNETFIANNPAYIRPETTHMEVHPSTIMSMMTSLIPFAPHNQSPRNQLSCSQSKQGLSIYATNWRNRFDNTAHVLCYGEMPLTRTVYNNYLGEGKMAYGMNCVLAIACWSGYNQEDGIVMNYDAVQRGMFRSMAFRSYEAFEEDDEKANTQTRIGNPSKIGAWRDLRPGLDYSKLDDNGIVREGEYVDENTVIIGLYLVGVTGGNLNDVSKTPQVWTRGRVEKVVVMYNNKGLRLVKIRVVQDRIPELGDKFSNRHGQKGTIGALLRGHDMPRTISGIVPDMIMNPHAIPSRMTIAQNLEQLLGKTASLSGAIGDGTSFMNDGSPQEAIGSILEEFGFEKYGNEVLYNGATGEILQGSIFIGPVYGMRLKHMVEDKWNARGKGRKEVRTHQPTGGRGAQGGLKIGEMDRDAIIAHAGMSFVKESYMERSDGTTMPICVSCGTIPIYNPRLKLHICSMCDGPVKYIGDTVNTLEVLPPLGRPKSKIVQVEIPYSTKLLLQEQETFLNLCTRFITTSGVQRLTPLEYSGKSSEMIKELAPMIYPEVVAPAYIEAVDEAVMSVNELRNMGVAFENFNALDVIQEEQPEIVVDEALPSGNQIINVPIAIPSPVPTGVNVPLGEEQPVQLGVPLVGGAINTTTPVLFSNQIQPMGGFQQVQMGGLTMPNSIVTFPEASIKEAEVSGPKTPVMGPMLAVDTSMGAFERDGIGFGGMGMGMGMNRMPRRNPFRSMGGGMMNMSMMSSDNESGGISQGGSSNMAVKVNKME
jgi:DNA-directed RNA polymerase II subunit RPB2